MSKVILTCLQCNKQYSIPKGIFNKQIVRGTKKKFCSSICHSNNRNKIFSWYLRECTRRTKNKNRQDEFNLTHDYLDLIWNKQKGVCPLSGLKLILRRHSYIHVRSIFIASLDRIDNNLWYQKDNVRFVSIMANYCRNTFMDTEVIAFCKAVSKYNK